MKRKQLLGRAVALFLAAAMTLADAGTFSVKSYADEVNEGLVTEVISEEIADEVSEVASEETDTIFDAEIISEEIVSEEIASSNELTEETEQPEASFESNNSEISNEITYGLSEELVEAVINKDVEYLQRDALGEDGVRYENVKYLSNLAYASLSAEDRESYLWICGELLSTINAEDEKDAFVFAVNQNGQLQFVRSVSAISFSETMDEMNEEVVKEIIGEEPGDLQDETTESPAPTSTPSETPDIGDNETPQATPSETPLDEEAIESPIATPSMTPTATPDEASSLDEENIEENKEEAETSESPTPTATPSCTPTESSTATPTVSPTSKTEAIDIEGIYLEALEFLTGGNVVTENTSYIEEFEAEETVIYGEGETAEFDTLLNYQNKTNYFYNQLKTTDEKTIYSAAKAAMVSGGGNSFTLTMNSAVLNNMETYLCNALSALQLTYTSRFGWTGCGYSDGGWTYSGYRKNNTVYLTVVLKKSQHYTSSLESSATAKAKEVVNNAYTYAGSNYPKAVTYGIIKYIDQWICENNYYNSQGVNGVKSSATYYYCHSPYGIMLKGYGVCESYAKALSKMLDLAGITNMYVTSSDHAFVYVQMPNDSWYMVDSTWNDPGKDNPSQKKSTMTYLLCPDDGDTSHKPDGRAYVDNRGQLKGSKFNFPKLSGSKYSYSGANENIGTLNKTTLYLTPRAAETLIINNSNAYYKDYIKKWYSSDEKVAKVVNGRVTAVAPGTAIITCEIAGIKATCTVYVYSFGLLTFNSNSRNVLTTSYENADTVFNSSDNMSIGLSIVCNGSRTAQQIMNAGVRGVVAPTATSSNVKVATVATPSISGNNITLKVSPTGVGTSVITVRFAGKIARLTLKVTQKIQTSWFDYSEIPTSVEYIARAYRPAIKKTELIPRTCRYQVLYTNNLNAGTATVTIKGIGLYSGVITKTFTITPANVKDATFSFTKALYYAGKPVSTRGVARLNRRALRANVDYDILYKVGGTYTTTAPTNAGVYKVCIKGKGNYTGQSTDTQDFEIKKKPIGGVALVCPSLVRYTGSAVSPNYQVKIGATVLPSSDYTVSYKDMSGNTISTPKDAGRYKLVITPKTTNIAPTAIRTTIERIFIIR